jgi:hypothetical protein
VEAFGRLVPPTVFKTDVTRDPGQAGSIPVRLRHQHKRAGIDQCRLGSVALSGDKVLVLDRNPNNLQRSPSVRKAVRNWHWHWPGRRVS